MTELLPPALTRPESRPTSWTGVFLPPFAAGRTLPRAQAATPMDELVLDEFEPDEFELDDVAFDDVVYDEASFGAASFDDTTFDESDLDIEVSDASAAQPASEAAAFEAWTGSDTTAAGAAAPEPATAPTDSTTDEPVAAQTSAPAREAPDDVARLVARRLDELAEQVRTRGLAGLGDPQDPDALSRLIAALVAGYVSRSD